MHILTQVQSQCNPLLIIDHWSTYLFIVTRIITLKQEMK